MNPPKKEPANETAISKAGEVETSNSVAGMNEHKNLSGSDQGKIRFSVNEHESWRKSISNQPLEIHGLLDDEDIEDLLDSDPILDRLPAQRRKGQVSRLLDILDQLDRSKPNRGCSR
jgi:hypothetical protein